jgi:hypothetical protein
VLFRLAGIVGKTDQTGRAEYSGCIIDSHEDSKSESPLDLCLVSSWQITRVIVVRKRTKCPAFAGLTPTILYRFYIPAAHLYTVFIPFVIALFCHSSYYEKSFFK